MKRFLNITKALSDENRVRALASLQDGELCVCQIIELLKLAPSTVSKHLSILKQADLVETRKDGRWIYYRLPEKEEADPMVEAALTWFFSQADTVSRIQKDKELLKHILSLDINNLCRK